MVEEDDDLDLIFETLHDDRMSSCIEELLQNGLSQGAEDEGVEFSVNNLDVDLVDIPGIGEQATSLRVTAVLAVVD